jgi:phosphohistidine phosphatase SixA/ADP-ribose pyrophosphatase YjhB (NUDIX family)
VPGADPAIRAAGVVLWRRTPAGGVELGLVHRPKYDDWSLPKGKLDPGEHVVLAAVRETLEETGFGVRLGRPLPTQRYRVGPVDKEVRYWAAEATSGTFTPTDEVDQLRWVAPDQAPSLLTWRRDADLVTTLDPAALDTVPLVLLRHAKATPRKNWDGPDGERPLAPEGFRQAAALPPLLEAFGVRRVITSDAARTRQTISPYAESTGRRAEVEPLFGDDGFASSPDEALRCAAGLLPSHVPTVLCTHRPVLPWLVSVLLDGSPVATPAEVLPPAGFFVVHVLGGSPVAVERHQPHG